MKWNASLLSSHVTLLVVVFVVVCSSVWSFGSRFCDWRYIIARVSEMHVACHK